MAPAGVLLLHMALHLGWATGEPPGASSFRCYLPENMSNIDIRGCNTSTGPMTAAQCFLRCVEGFALSEAAPTLTRRGWAICPKDGGVFHLPECVPKPEMVAVQGGMVQWQVPRDPVTSLPCDSKSMAVSPDGRIMLCAGTPVRAWDVSALPVVRELAALNNSSADHVRFAADAKWAFTFKYQEADDGSVTICKWALDEPGHPIWTSSAPYSNRCSRPPVLSPDGEQVYFACSPMVLYSLAGGNITVLEVADIRDLRFPYNVMKSVVLGGAGAWVAAVDLTNTVYVWSPSQGLPPGGAKQSHQWASGVRVNNIAATHDGRHLLIGSGQRVLMYEVWTGEPVASFHPTVALSDADAKDGWIDAMVVSKDDDWLWAAGGPYDANWVALWSLRSGAELPAFKAELPADPLDQPLAPNVVNPHAVERHRDRVALSPDGRWGLVTSGSQVLLYELRLRPARPLTSLAFPQIWRAAVLYSDVRPSKTEEEYALLGLQVKAGLDGSGDMRWINQAYGFNLRTHADVDVRSMTDLPCVAQDWAHGINMAGSPSGWRPCFSYQAPAREVSLVNVLTGRLRNVTVGFDVSSMAVTPDGQRLFVLGGPAIARTLAMFSLLGDAPSPSRTWALPPADQEKVVDMQVGPSGSLVVISDPSGITAWDLISDHARLLCNYSGVRLAKKTSGYDLPVAIAPDESEVLVPAALNTYTIVAWSLRSCLAEPLASYTAHWRWATEPKDMFTISADGHWLTLINGMEAYLWDRHSADEYPVAQWSASANPTAVSVSPDGAWTILTHQQGVDLWPILPSLAYDRALEEVGGIKLEGGAALRTTHTPIRLPTWLGATSLRTLDLHSTAVADFDWQVPSTLIHMNLSGASARRGGLKLSSAWLQTMGMTIDLRGVPDVDVGELAENPRFQRDMSSCAVDFSAHGLCLRRRHDEKVRRFVHRKICSSAFAVWQAGGDGGTMVQRATVYADATSLDRWLCDCPEGTYGDGRVCAECPEDSFCPAPRPDTAQAINEVAHPCPRGSGTNGARGRTSNASCLCKPGWRSVGRGGVAPCQTCEDGSFAAGWGAESCGSCGFGQLPIDGLAACDLHWEYLATLGSLVAVSACVALACPLACGRGVPLAEVALEDGRVVLTTTSNHRFLHRAPAAFDVHIHGTGCPGLDQPGKNLPDCPAPFKVCVLSSKRLLLLDQQGGCITAQLDASQGWVRVQAPQAFLALGVIGVPVGVMMLVLFGLWAYSVAALVRFEPASPNLTVVAVVLGLDGVFGLAKYRHWRWRAERSTLRREIENFRDRIQKHNPDPRACERGPGRAVTMAQLDDLHRAFQAFTRDTRIMHYLWHNVLKPITAPEKLSYAELVGPSVVEWFCSHYWGNPFAHFAESVRRHALAVGEREGRDARLMSYWICSLSNNQWAISDELPGRWQDSSFYLALRSGHCRGTTMILDEAATPLTRSWCLFEVLQTLRLSREDAHFQGLLLCTSTGVLNYGEARLDVAMAIAERLVTLDLREATASVEADKAMIDDLVVRDFGGFEVVNDFVRGRIRDALDTMRVRVDQDMSRLALALAGAPARRAHSPQRQPTLPSLLVPGPAGGESRSNAGRLARPSARESSPKGPDACRDEFPDV